MQHVVEQLALPIHQFEYAIELLDELIFRERLVVRHFCLPPEELIVRLICLVFAYAGIVNKKIRTCESFMKKSPLPEICTRIAQVRLDVAGRRGKARFAKQLGIAASTYDYYESGRVPPGEILLRISDLGGVDLRWLLTGEVGSPAVAADNPIIRRAAALLADRPQAEAPLAAFLDVLAESMKFPAGAADQSDPDRVEQPSQDAQPADGPDEDWIPILGRSAAGVPHFWDGDDGTRGITSLAELAGRHAGKRSISTAVAREADAQDNQPIHVITLRSPDSTEVSQFLAAGDIRQRYPDAFAMRIDGESMSPDIRHGQIVIVSPSVPAVNGRAAVVQLDRQIGVTCKLYRHDGQTVHLVPVNEHFAPQQFPAEQVVWALRVLACVQVGPGNDAGG